MRPRRAPRRAARPLRHGRVAQAAPAPERRAPLTTRAALLGLAVSAVAVLLALPARTYFSQQSHISETVAAQNAARHRIQLLQQQYDALQNPAVVEDQARQRLGYVQPGETMYQVVDPPRPSPSAGKPDAAAAAVPVTKQSSLLPWWSKLWKPASR